MVKATETARGQGRAPALATATAVTAVVTRTSGCWAMRPRLPRGWWCGGAPRRASTAAASASPWPRTGQRRGGPGDCCSEREGRTLPPSLPSLGLQSEVRGQACAVATQHASANALLRWSAISVHKLGYVYARLSSQALRTAVSRGARHHRRGVVVDHREVLRGSRAQSGRGEMRRVMPYGAATVLLAVRPDRACVYAKAHRVLSLPVLAQVPGVWLLGQRPERTVPRQS